MAVSYLDLGAPPGWDLELAALPRPDGQQRRAGDEEPRRQMEEAVRQRVRLEPRDRAQRVLVPVSM